MRPTGRTRALAAAAGALVLAGLVSLTVAPGLLGMGLAVYLAHARWAARAAFQRSRPRLARQVLEDLVAENQALTLELDATGSRLAPGVTVRFRAELPDGIEPLDADETPHLVGTGRRTYACRATERGSHRFPRARARLEDRLGLWRETREVGPTPEVNALPPREAIEEGRRLARRDPPEATTRDPLGHVLRELEFEGLREHQPADRLRDIDWKQVAKLGELISKEWEAEREAPIVLLVDASRTMRARNGDTTKLDHAAHLALELSEAVVERGHPTGYVAFDELRVLDEARPSRARSVPEQLARSLAELPDRVRTRRRLDVGLPGDHPADETELGVLETLASLGGDGQAGGGSGAIGLQRALAAYLRDRAQTAAYLVLLTDLEHLANQAIQLVGRAVREGHEATAVVLPGSAFLDPPEDPRARDLEHAYKELQTRERARRLLEARGVSVVEIGPADTAAQVTFRGSGGTPPRAGGGGTGRHRPPERGSEAGDRDDPPGDGDEASPGGGSA